MPIMPDDVCGSDDAGPEFKPEEISVLWPQARSELLGFAKYLDSRNAGITACQIKLAVQLADRLLAERAEWCAMFGAVHPPGKPLSPKEARLLKAIFADPDAAAPDPPE